jgi:hypothetical protein
MPNLPGWRQLSLALKGILWRSASFPIFDIPFWSRRQFYPLASFPDFGALANHLESTLAKVCQNKGL